MNVEAYKLCVASRNKLTDSFFMGDCIRPYDLPTDRPERIAIKFTTRICELLDFDIALLNDRFPGR